MGRNRAREGARRREFQTRTQRGTVAIVAATDHLAQVTERTAGRLPGPGNTWVTRDAGRAFLDLLPVNFRGTHLFATQVFVMDLDAAMHAGTSPTQDAP